MSANNPKHGDSIIRQAQDPLGGSKLVATQQFQRFLDELGSLVNVQSDGDEQIILSLTSQIGKNRASITGNKKLLNDLLQHVAVINTENGRLRGVIHEQATDLECLKQELFAS